MAGVLCAKGFFSWLWVGVERYCSGPGEEMLLSIVRSSDSLGRAGVEIKRY